MFWVYTALGVIVLVLAMAAFRSRRRVPSPQTLDGQLKYFRDKAPVCPSGQFALVYFDMDPGVLMGGLPDQQPKFISGQQEALEEAKAQTGKDEELSIGVFSPSKNLIAVVLWGEVYRYNSINDRLEISTR